MSQFIDRRATAKNRTTINRSRFIQRFKKQIKESVAQAINKRSITDMANGESINIPKKDISEPFFHHGQGGVRRNVLPGNTEFVRGDKLARPPQEQGGSGSQASNQGEGLDDFTFELSKEEFLDLFFEDLALPDLVKTRLSKMPTLENVRAGYSKSGAPQSIHIVKTFKNALGRKKIFAGSYNKKIKKLEADLLETPLDNIEKRKTLAQEIERYQNKISKIPFIDNFDIRYISRAKRLKTSTQAVMFCSMDVSGSMDENKKEIAKRFFILLYLFLTKNYQKIDIIFIRHHTTAKEVGEEEFFYSRETGGTVVSSALELTHKILKERYNPDDWNIYIAQASDGDNWNADSPHCQELLMHNIMPYVQYYAYVEILPRHHQSLWRSYSEVKDFFPNFAMRNINEAKDIYPVFHELFKRKL